MGLNKAKMIVELFRFNQSFVDENSPCWMTLTSDTARRSSTGNRKALRFNSRGGKNFFRSIYIFFVWSSIS